MVTVVAGRSTPGSKLVETTVKEPSRRSSYIFDNYPYHLVQFLLSVQANDGARGAVYSQLTETMYKTHFAYCVLSSFVLGMFVL